MPANSQRYSTNLDAAISAFQSGRLNDALQICHELLESTPNDVNTVNFSGVVYDALGNKQLAIDCFRRAVNLSPGNVQLLTNLGSTLIDIGDVDEARDVLNNALAINSSYAETHYSLGNINFIEAKYEAAIEHYQHTLVLNPQHMKSLNNLAKAYQKIANTSMAKEIYTNMLAINPQSVEALVGLGSVLYFAQEKEQALAHYHKALAYNPGHESANFMVGRLLLESDDKKKEALPFLEKARNILPDDINILNALGEAYLLAEDFVQAEQSLLKSLNFNPEQVRTLNILGQVYHELQRSELAVHYYQQALALEPENSYVLNNLGLIQREMGNYDASETYFKQAIALEKEVFSIEKENAINNLSLTELLLEKFETGWDHYRSRASVRKTELVNKCPDRENLDLYNKSILWVKDQGIGDELFFLRFLPLLAKYNCKNTYRCSKKLRPLLENTSFIDKLYDSDDIGEDFDYCLSIADLPYILNHSENYHTPPPLDLKPSETAKARIQEVLKNFGPPPYIGISWRAGNPNSNRRIGTYYKFFEPRHITNILKQLPGTVISLQVNADQDELEEMSRNIERPILDVGQYHDELENMLAVLDLIDIYIAVSNTYVHLRESLNKPSHVFINNPPEWRWLTDGDQSYWFPHSTAYRQDKNGSWKNAITECLADLHKINFTEQSYKDRNQITRRPDKDNTPSDNETYDATQQFQLANQMMQASSPLEAIPIYQRLLQIAPNNAAYLNNLASAYDVTEQYDKAIKLYKKAIENAPDYSGTYANLGRVLCDTQQLDEAEIWLKKGITKSNKDVSNFINLGRVYNFKQDFVRSRELYQQALSLAPQNPTVLFNLGSSYQKTGELEQAEIFYQRCLNLTPGHNDAELNLGICQLGLGKFNSAWGHYFKRVRHLTHNEQLSPINPGQNFQGKTVYLCFSQGIGDELFFLRFIPAIKQQNARIIYRCSNKLFPLLKNHPWLDQVISEDQALPNADFYFTVDDLPLITAMHDVQQIPNAMPLSPNLSNSLTKMLDKLPRPYIGVTWRAGTQIEVTNFRNNKRQLSKLFALDDMIGLLKGCQGTIVILQRNPEPHELAILAENFQHIFDASEYNNDLEAMLSLLNTLDDSIAVSNTNIHLLAGLGKSGRVLIPHPPEWRWMKTEGSSPWFPGFTTYRQAKDGSWIKALINLKSDLEATNVFSK